MNPTVSGHLLLTSSQNDWQRLTPATIANIKKTIPGNIKKYRCLHPIKKSADMPITVTAKTQKQSKILFLPAELFRVLIIPSNPLTVIQIPFLQSHTL
jgi:hypothetical protein